MYHREDGISLLKLTSSYRKPAEDLRINGVAPLSPLKMPPEKLAQLLYKYFASYAGEV